MWITITEAADLMGLTNSGFHSQLTEEYKREKRGSNIMKWKREGKHVLLDKQSVLDYFDSKRKGE